MGEKGFTPVESTYKSNKELLQELNSEKTRKYIIDVAHKVSFDISPADADDVAQETMLKATKALESNKFKEEGKFNTWLYEITKNTIFSLHRSRARKHKKGLVDKIPEGFEAKDEKPTPKDDIETTENLKILQVMIKKLPPQYQVIAEFLLQGKSYGEIAQALNIKTNTAGTRIFTTRKLLKQLINGYTQHK